VFSALKSELRGGANYPCEAPGCQQLHYILHRTGGVAGTRCEWSAEFAGYILKDLGFFVFQNPARRTDMSTRFPLYLSIFILCALPAIAQAQNNSDIPETTIEGLKLVENPKQMAYVWAQPGADLSQYERVYITEPLVAFKKNWQREQNRGHIKVRSSDIERIKNNVAGLFLEVLTEELGKGGYTLANERAEDVLLVRPAIIDLDVTAPDVRTTARSQTFTTSAGSMTLYIELIDSETGDMLAKALDRKADRDTGTMQWQTGPANRAAALRIMRPWAEALREALDEARELTHQEQEK